MLKLSPVQDVRGWQVVERHDDLQHARATTYRHCECCDELLAVDRRTGKVAHPDTVVQQVDVA
jgi:hypothetical protein